MSIITELMDRKLNCGLSPAARLEWSSFLSLIKNSKKAGTEGGLAAQKTKCS